jgi:hypothetical protein
MASEKTMAPTKTLGDALPEQQARCRELLEQYVEIGPAGAFGAAMIRQALAKAERASISGDVIEMIRAHEELKSFK